MVPVTVKKITYKTNPADWRSHSHVYVARRHFNRSGLYKGQRYPQSCLANPFTGLGAVAEYENWLRRSRDRVASDARYSLLELASRQDSGEEIVLGCWCGDWDGVNLATRPRCHAAFLAEVLNQRPEWFRDVGFARGEEPK